MKKVLIATLFACIILILPLNNVVGVSDVEDDCNCKPVSNLHLVILERLSNKLDRLLNRAEVYTGIISILYKYKPDVTEEFKELSSRITVLQEGNNDLKSVFEFGLHDEICDALLELEEQTLYYASYVKTLIYTHPELKIILEPIYNAFMTVNIMAGFYYSLLGCNIP